MAATACCSTQRAAELKIPLIFDPGQGMPMFDGNDLKNFIDLATYVAVNDYEAELLTARTGLSLAQIAERVTALVVTRGELGADIFVGGKHHAIPCEGRQDRRSTGCGDASAPACCMASPKATTETTGRLASLMGSIKIASQGPQNHARPAEIEALPQGLRLSFRLM
jgi:adenosine kinase